MQVFNSLRFVENDEFWGKGESGSRLAGNIPTHRSFTREAAMNGAPRRGGSGSLVRTQQGSAPISYGDASTRLAQTPQPRFPRTPHRREKPLLTVPYDLSVHMHTMCRPRFSATASSLRSSSAHQIFRQQTAPPSSQSRHCVIAYTLQNSKERGDTCSVRRHCPLQLRTIAEASSVSSIC